mmetsp:Transcript_91148/g.258085  ORF Transcript_91148/g.258085 Transcript_91148/m.258085 type:complete len:259 (-) Transcript_91148:470-1246(-)
MAEEVGRCAGLQGHGLAARGAPRRLRLGRAPAPAGAPGLRGPLRPRAGRALRWRGQHVLVIRAGPRGAREQGVAPRGPEPLHGDDVAVRAGRPVHLAVGERSLVNHRCLAREPSRGLRRVDAGPDGPAGLGSVGQVQPADGQGFGGGAARQGPRGLQARALPRGQPAALGLAHDAPGLAGRAPPRRARLLGAARAPRRAGVAAEDVAVRRGRALVALRGRGPRPQHGQEPAGAHALEQGLPGARRQHHALWRRAGPRG